MPRVAQGELLSPFLLDSLGAVVDAYPSSILRGFDYLLSLPDKDDDTILLGC